MSCTIAPARDTRTAPTANATVIPSSSPTGTTVVTVAVVALSDSARPRSSTLYEMSSASVSTIVAPTRTRSRRFMWIWSGVMRRTSWRASDVSLSAYASFPTRSAV